MGDYYRNAAYELNRETGVFGDAELFEEIGFVEFRLIIIRMEQTVEAEHTSATRLIVDNDVLLLHILEEYINLKLRVKEGAVEYREDEILFSAGVKIRENPCSCTAVVASLKIALAVCECLCRVGRIGKLQGVILLTREKLLDVKSRHKVVCSGAIGCE